MHTATSSDKINLSSEKHTEELANKLIKKIKTGNIVFLHGEMGVGKTTLVKYLINGYQKNYKLKLTEVTSPTFALLNEYKIDKIKINHFDLFRLKSEEELVNLDMFANSSESITLIEWPQIIKEKPKNLVELFFEYEDDLTKRSVRLKGIDI
ncbi:tRNA (adenosine(37)-N6)-threonylcarbamoyltransferase complex ATPase subunit type 1 TsaE [Candidatus Pelagibacter sp.]|nr:tRNA (adenosine(37)-N6)-threonylcarbamoyltransferase complex ATPase subunit type 1 TsaE [Candidatus Pelagibacter sp.]